MAENSLNISDVIEVIGADDMATNARVVITEQPAGKALRFRYECEGRSAGSIPGVHSTPENKTYPTIKILGYQGRAVVVVSCVTKDPPYRPHPHNLVGKEGCARGVCTLRMNSDTISFSNLGIQCVKKKDIEEALKTRQEIRVDPFRTGFAHRQQPSNIDLNSVRLCFQVFREGPKEGEFKIPIIPPVVSDPIYDKKAMSDLTICRLSDCSASVTGGKEIILLCEKVAKEDIQVRFYEVQDGNIVWEAPGDFTPQDVHKQFAIAFKTPSYRDMNVDRPVEVYIQLRRPSDGTTSEAKNFTLIPLDAGRPGFWTLRKALYKKGDYGTFSEILTAEAQKRKLETISSSPEESKKMKDSLISGGALITLPTPTLELYEQEPKVIGLDLAKSDLALSDKEMETVTEPMQLDEKSKDESFRSFDVDNNSLGALMDKDKEDSLHHFLEKDKEESFDLPLSNKSKEENSFDDLITQVAELDEIYSEARNRLQLEDVEMHCPELFDDSQTYTSLQLAMKNPIEVMSSYEDVTPVHSPVIDVSKPSADLSPNVMLPPLPPKRVKQTPPGRPDTSPPSRDLPKTPDASRAKSTIFSKLFSKKKGGKTMKRHSLSSESLKSEINKTSLEDVTPKSPEKGFSKWFHRGSTGSLVAEPSLRDDIDGAKENLELDVDLDLAEAENYALYDANAPHATVSEFDEMSSYYSPVEGGKILKEHFLSKTQNVSS